jgi:hypothetical protein
MTTVPTSRACSMEICVRVSISLSVTTSLEGAFVSWLPAKELRRTTAVAAFRRFTVLRRRILAAWPAALERRLIAFA